MSKHPSLCGAIRSLIFAACLLGWATVEGATINVACPGQTLQAGLDSAGPGDTIAVTGACNENVTVRNEKQRLLISGSGATISGPNSTSPTLNVRGKGITIQGFTITGGRDGINVNRGSNAVIQGNIIQGTGRHGILIDQLSFAVITGNTIQNNLSGSGIVVSENSVARIGFNLDTDGTASPNTIQGNAGPGIVLSRTSSARIVGNTVNANTGTGSDGIQVTRLSQADLAKNDIRSNSGNGVLVTQNSGVNLPDVAPTGSFFDDPNTTTVLNNVNGIRCTLGGFVNGHTGPSGTQLNGTSGPTNIDSSCPSSLSTP
ncbi:MAG TPA: right-handed parallel beta-helix repeat-containing protein [Methylomirabilota bacterium]|nr:right-handed parallel beta-helix repeat-containing protein [Methylomirabilota bacterium]